MTVASSAAAASVVISSSLAHQVKVAHCKTVLLVFDSKSAKVSAMKEYADCINTLYPTELSVSAVIILKALFIIALIGLVSGIVWHRLNEKYEGWFRHILVGFVWFLFAPFIVIFVSSIFYGIWWLFAG